MIPETGDLRLEDRLRATGEHHLSLLHRGEGGRIGAAIAAAVAIHVAALLIPFPAAGSSRSPAPRPAVRKPVEAQAVVPGPPELPHPAPPTREAPGSPVVAAVRPASISPAPAPLPDVLEPLVESEQEMAPDELPSDVAILLGAPEPPPAGPTPVETGVATVPELIPESRVLPVFPQRARQLGVSGTVLLDVSVLADGSVGAVTVLRCTPSDVGFCQSAARAVKRWRYRPALHNGRPVQAYVTVQVDFVP